MSFVLTVKKIEKTIKQEKTRKVKEHVYSNMGKADKFLLPTI